MLVSPPPPSTFAPSLLPMLSILREPQEGDASGFLSYLPGAGIFPCCLAEDWATGLELRWKDLHLSAAKCNTSAAKVQPQAWAYTPQEKADVEGLSWSFGSLRACILPSRNALCPSPIQGRRRGGHSFAQLLTFSRLSALSSSPGCCIHPHFRASLASTQFSRLQKGFPLKLKSTKQHSTDNL